MKEGFLLDGIGVQAAGLPVDQGVVRSSLVLPDAAVAPLLIAELAAALAEEALHLPVGVFLIVAGFDSGEVGLLPESGQAGAEGGQARAQDNAGPDGTPEELAPLHFKRSSSMTSILPGSAVPRPMRSAVAR